MRKKQDILDEAGLDTFEANNTLFLEVLIDIRDQLADSAAETGSGSVSLLQRELRDIKTTVGEMAEQIRYQRMPALPVPLKDIYKRLVENELAEEITSELIQNLYGRFSEEEYI